MSLKAWGAIGQLAYVEHVGPRAVFEETLIAVVGGNHRPRGQRSVLVAEKKPQKQC